MSSVYRAFSRRCNMLCLWTITSKTRLVALVPSTWGHRKVTLLFGWHNDFFKLQSLCCASFQFLRLCAYVPSSSQLVRRDVGVLKTVDVQIIIVNKRPGWSALQTKSPGLILAYCRQSSSVSVPGFIKAFSFWPAKIRYFQSLHFAYIGN